MRAKKLYGTEDFEGCLVAYRVAMSLAEDMLSREIITEEEYRKIDRIVAKKYGLSSCTIYLREPLINGAFRGNMLPTKKEATFHGTGNQKH